MKNAAVFALLAILAVAAPTPARAEIRTAPLPEGEKASEFWSAEIGEQRLAVYTARTADPPFEKYDYGGEYAFLSFDADEPVELTVHEKSGANLDNLTIRPKSLGIVPERASDGSIKIKVDRPCQFSVEYDGRKHPLLVFANPLEKDVPNPNDENVVYFGPGLHQPEGGAVRLRDNQTLYLAAGAVVQCGIEAKGDNITIRGRGIIDSTPWKWREGPTGHVLSIRDSHNVRLEGVVIRGASRWTVVPVNSEDVAISNIKLCGGRAQNDDGINPCNSRRVRVENTFVRTDDDCMALKGLDVAFGNCEDVTVENCVFWCDRARIVLMGHESRAEYMRRVVFRNIDVIHAQTRNFLLEPGEDMRMEDLLFDNIRFETGKENALSPEALEKMKELDTKTLRFDVDVANKDNWLFVGRPVVNQYMKTKVPGHIKNVVVSNITVEGPLSYCGVLFSGADEDHRTENLTLRNIDVFGTKLDKDSPLIHLGDFLDGVKIE